MTWFNEYEAYPAKWLRNLWPEAIVDERSIADLRADDVVGHRAHFFAGIGGWEYALQLAGWPDDRPVWTGSCPCQPFSSAGKGKGAADPRHLWPAWFNLIRQRHPECIFGEQVASAIGHGWLDLVFADLEGEGYACGAVVLGAHSVGAPHIRQRLYWVAHRPDGGRIEELAHGSRIDGRSSEEGRPAGSGLRGPSGRLGNSLRPTSPRLGPLRIQVEPEQEPKRPRDATPWAGSVLIRCADGKARPVEPSIFPLAHGFPGRVGILRAAGNAIVPQVAAEFIRAFVEQF